MNRFLRALRAAESPFDFFSFEYYPFDDVCSDAAPQLLEIPHRLRAMLSSLHDDGVPSDIPWLMTEFDELKCSWGNLMMLQISNADKKLNRLSTYYSARLITNDWMQWVTKTHEVYPVTIEPDNAGVTAYAVRRPDKQWALLAVNKDPNRSAQLSVQFTGASVDTFTGKVDIAQFSRQQYRWQEDGPNGRPLVSNLPSHLQRAASRYYELPPYSVSVLRGHVGR